MNSGVAVLKAVGYWVEDVRIFVSKKEKILSWLRGGRKSEIVKYHECCVPSELPKCGYSDEVKERIIGYLSAGYRYSAELGYSWCRFKCGIESHEMGDKDLTDGEWIWPEGYVHYLKEHDVKVPDEFVKAMSNNNWVVPAIDLSVVLKDECLSYEYWYEWCRREKQS
jgi:hypothetical protein